MMEISFYYEGRLTQEIIWIAPTYTLLQVVTLLKNKVAHTTLVHSLVPSIVRNDTNEVIALVRTVDNNSGEFSEFQIKD